MKKLFLAVLLTALFSFSYTQNSLKSKLLEVYSLEKTESIMNDSQKKKYYSNLIFNSYRTESIPTGKMTNSNLPVLSTVQYKNIDGSITTLSAQKVVELINEGSFNILKAQIQRDYKSVNSYLLGSTNVVLSLYSYTYLTQLQKK